MTETTLPDGRPRRAWGLRLGLLLLLWAGLGWGGYLAVSRLSPEKHPGEDGSAQQNSSASGSDDELAAALAETDRLDPFWRLEEIEEQREKVLDEENSAAPVLEARGLMPEKWTDFQLHTFVKRYPPQQRLRAAQRAMFEDEMKVVQPALVAAQRLLHRARGRYPLDINSNEAVYFFGHWKAVQDVCDLLWVNAIYRATTGNLPGALSSWRCLLNAARSLGDEQLTFSQMRRHGGRRRTLSALETILAQGELTEGDLLSMQRALEEESRYPSLRFKIRAARANMHRHFLRYKSENVNWQEVAEEWRDKGISADELKQSCPGSHAWLLRYYNQARTVVELPPHEQLPRMRALEETAKTAPALARIEARQVHSDAEFCQLGLAQLRCGIAALAVERYRLAFHRWPDSLQGLVPRYLHEVPADPMNGAPLRYRSRAGGRVVYSIGPNGVDDRGNCPQGAQYMNDPDLGFLLWDASRRGEPAR